MAQLYLLCLLLVFAACQGIPTGSKNDETNETIGSHSTEHNNVNKTILLKVDIRENVTLEQCGDVATKAHPKLLSVTFIVLNQSAATGICSVSMPAEEDPCQPNPCENGGVCTKAAEGGYTCTCPPKFQGKRCEVPIATQ